MNFLAVFIEGRLASGIKGVLNIGFFISLFVITSCSTSIESTKKCKGNPKDITSISKKKCSENLACYQYFDSVFPLASLTQNNCVKCVTIEGNHNTGLASNIQVKPISLIVDTMGIKGLVNLRSLSISWFNLNDFNYGLRYLTNLESLEMSVGLLDSIPNDIKRLSKLEILSLRANNITQLPEWFGSLKRLKALDLSNNRLTKIPLQLILLDSLEVISLANIEGYRSDPVNPKYVMSTNQIDYQKCKTELSALLSKKQLKKMIIEVKSPIEKKMLLNVITPKELCKKITFTYPIK